MRRTLFLFDGLNRLQDFLVAMTPGEQVTAKRASEISGLDCQRCDSILDALMRAGVMMRLQNDVYVRCRLQQIERHFTPTAEPMARRKAPVLLPGDA